MNIKTFTLLIKSIVLLSITLIHHDSYATHFQGGEITMSCLGGNQYRVSLSIYRDCAGVNVPNNLTVTYNSTSCGLSENITLNLLNGSGIEVTPACSTTGTVCNGGSLPGTEEFIYSGIINNLAACDDWVFSIRTFARNNAITTITNAGSEGMYLESRLDNLNYPCNSSPTFTNKPIPFICLGETFCFNNGGNDVDGDSLSYSMVDPLNNVGDPVNYVSPFSASQPLASSPAITIDPVTGDICITPSQLHVTVFAVLVNEWRNGILIGQIRRDVQMRVITCNNSNPSLNGINNTGVYNMDVCSGTPINFNIPSFDADASDSLTLTWNNGVSGGIFNPGTGQTPSASFSWTPSVNDVSSVPHCFTVTVADNNCPFFGTQSYSFCITVAGGFSTTISSTDVICDNTNGTAMVQASGTSITPSGYTYLWTPSGASTASLTGLSAGDYTVTTSDQGCSRTDSITIRSTNLASATISSFTNLTCNGIDDGSITASLSGSGVVAPLTYNWLPPAVVGNVNTATNLAPGTYSVIITDNQGCADTVTQTITEPLPLLVSTNSVNVGCFGSSTGSAIANVSGGSGGFSYLWTPGAFNTTSISSLPVGMYTVTVTDMNNCVSADSLVISQPNELTISDVISPANCGQSDGSVTVSGSGGFPPYTWLWSNGQVGPVANNLASGTYSVTLTDLNLCTKTVSVSVGDNLGPIVQVTSLGNVICNGDSDGEIVTSASGGSFPYSYSWNTGQNSPAITNLDAGTYSLNVTDASGCNATLDTIITEPTALTNNFITVNPNCFGDSSGAITANVLGGVSPYNYLWSTLGSPTTLSLNNIGAGSYTVTITDANGCSISRSQSLVSSPNMTATLNIQDVNCFGTCEGVASVNITNGVAPFSYSWNDPLNQTTDSAKFLCAGSYQVNITDANGCSAQAVGTINEPATAINAALSAKGDLVCYQDCIGFAQVTVTGGVGPYTYNWSNGDSTATVANLCAGNYTCAVVDNNGCTSIVSVTITEPSELIATVTASDIKCFGTCDGVGNISFSGGTAPYSFLWTPGLQTIDNPNNLCVGQNIGEITDNNGCKVSDTITLVETFTPLTVTQNVVKSNCGLPTGSGCVVPSGGAAPYSYVWNNPGVSNTSCITNQFAGAYTVDITDSVGCLITEFVNISDVVVLVTTVTHTDLTCYGDTNGTAVTNITGGVPPYTFAWLPGGQTTQNPINLRGGTNTVTVTDSLGCNSSFSFVVLEPTKIISVINSITDVSCFGLCNGTGNILTTGGTGPLSILWNDPSSQNTGSISNLCAGNYTATITDLNNCIDTNVLIITEPLALTIDSSSIKNLNCFQDNTGSIYTNVSGGTPFHTFNWTPNISSSSIASALSSGNYSLEVVDQNGCTISNNWTITEPSLLTGISSFQNASCASNNGSAMIVTNGGTAPYSYQWNDPMLQITPNAVNLFGGNYSVNVTDSNNCSFTQNYAIPNDLGPVIDSLITTDVTCFGGTNGEISTSIAPNTGEMPFNFQWTPGTPISQNINGLVASTYSILVTDSNGCTATGNAIVNEPSALTLFKSQNDTICYGDSTQIYVQASGGTAPYTYLWTGLPAGLTGPGVHQVSPTATTTYSVNVVDSNSCTITPVDITITVLPSLNITVTDTFLCENDSVTINALVSGGNGNPYTYSWSNGDTNQMQTVSPDLVNSPISYIVTVNDGCSAPVNDTVIVTVNANPVIDSIMTTDILCYGDSTGTADVFLDMSLAQAPFTYDWGFVSQTNPLVSGLNLGYSYVNIIDNNGCETRDSVLIDQPDSLSISLIGDTICYGGLGEVSASVLGGTAPYIYQWTGLPTGLTGAGPHQVSPTTTTTYLLNIVDSNNCSALIQSNVDVVVRAPLSLVTINDSLCENQTKTISAIPSGGIANSYTYDWSNGTTFQSTTISVNQVDTFYTVTLNDGCSTPVTDTLFVTIYMNPVASISATPQNGCAPLDITFSTIGNGVQYFWDYGDDNSDNTVSNMINHSYTEEGPYDVSLTVISLEGCSTVIDSFNYINVFPNPVADFSMNQNPITTFDLSVQFTDLSTSNISFWQWDFAGLATSTASSPTFLFPELEGEHTINLKVTDENGCVDSIYQILTIESDWAIYVPNTFTPNSDGKNEVFSPVGSGIVEDGYRFDIFNRWGELIFETTTLFEPWNGTFKGVPVPQGAYVWKLTFRDVSGGLHKDLGKINILR